ncbi:hypothetical protein BGK67_00955 [Streptomyces subrutilus]|uniref:Uncharacterized protein n=1 Tax=Streptomyces subrutilus TaxID=36818 RepID=A0A1E5PKP0_9ACTN|nr:hypothetical protein BGK67_00955 [Streptomyces subrutilus]
MPSTCGFSLHGVWAWSTTGAVGSTACGAQLLEFFPVLERALDLTKEGPAILLTAYRTPATIRRMGVRRLEGMAP